MPMLMPLIMFALLIVCLLIGIPIVYALGMVALGCSFVLWGPGSIFGLVTATISTMGSWTLLAVPLFTFMSLVLFETGVVEDLYETFYRFTANLRGGLAVCTVLVGAMMGAMTGVVAGTVVALTTIALPQMLKYKYDKNISMGAILSGGTLGQLIPPSTVMIVYGTMTGVSVGGLFAGGISCGLLLAALYCAYILIRCAFNKSLCPTMPKEDQLPMRENLKKLKNVIAPIILIVIVLGSIFGGIATPTEAAAVGSTGAIVIAVFRRKMTLRALKNASVDTLKMTSMVGFITLAASFFGTVFIAIGGNKFVLGLADIIPFGAWGVLLITMLIVFFLGMFIDTIAIVVICAPIFTPLITAAGFDPLWFALCFLTNVQMAYLTPPFGFSLFYLKGAAPEGIELKHIYKSSLPFIAVQFTGLVLCIIFPALATWGVKVFM
ncbi:MAG: TRAP transporter large permease subunit [Oscillospiraceae bacterium]